MMNEILDALSRPFEPSDVSWKPGSITKDSTKCMALAYGDLRAYMDRLDEVCGLDWSVRYLPWGDKRIICELTIAGVTRSSTGEMGESDEISEIGGTVAEAQAMKRAAAQFGLGRFLYNFPSTWVDFDAAAKRISKTGQAELDNRYIAWYAKTMAQSVKRTAAAPVPLRAVDAATGEISEPPTIHAQAADDALWEVEPYDAPAAASSKDKVLSTAQLARLHALGSAIYGDGWNAQREKLVAAVSKGSVTSSKQLTPDEASTLIVGLEKKQASRVQSTGTNGMVTA